MEFSMRTDRITLTDHEIQNSLARLQHFLLQLDENINWDRVKKTLEPLDPSRKNVAGRNSYEPLKMFRIMLLQSWYDLSDPEMEFYLNTNLLFLSFAGSASARASRTTARFASGGTALPNQGCLT